MLFTAAIAVAFALGRVLLQGRAPLQLDRALAECDALRIEYSKRGQYGEEIVVSFEITQPDVLKRLRTLLDLPSASEIEAGEVILGGPPINVTLFDHGEETSSFRVLASVLAGPARPLYKTREYGLSSDEAWSMLLELEAE
jgi:hypothetical protein